jgi:hypothetical protein
MALTWGFWTLLITVIAFIVYLLWGEKIKEYIIKDYESIK